MVLFGIDIQWLLFEHFSPWQWDSLHCGNAATSRYHLIEGEDKDTVLNMSRILQQILFTKRQISIHSNQRKKKKFTLLFHTHTDVLSHSYLDSPTVAYWVSTARKFHNVSLFYQLLA